MRAVWRELCRASATPLPREGWLVALYLTGYVVWRWRHG
jgi:hypothetical protein